MSMATSRPLNAPAHLTLARRTLARFGGLWLPPILINTFEGLAATPLASMGAQMVVLVSANLAGFLIEAGWIAMIGRALQGTAPGVRDFTDGVNRRWGTMLIGNFAFFALIAAAFAGFWAYGDVHYGAKTLMAWWNGLAHLAPAQFQAAFDPNHLAAPIQGWMFLFGAWMSVSGLIGFLLLYWQPLAVLANLSWWRAFGASASLVVRRFGLSLLFACMHAAVLFVGFTVATAGDPDHPLPALFGFMLMLVASAFFKILYSGVVADDRALLTPAVDTQA